MIRFKEFQFATLVFAIIIPIQVLLTFLFAYPFENSVMPIPSFVLTNLGFAIVGVLFYGMTTRVDDNVVYVHYGVGLIRKSISLSEIKSVHVVTTPWYYGWGIRFIPNGMLYNMKGLSGVELTFKDRSRIIRIGSQHASKLQRAIAASIALPQ